MTDLVKGVLGGGWSLVAGWIVPVFVTLELARLLIAPSVDLSGVRHFRGGQIGSQQAVLLAIAAVLGLVLAAAKTPLYRVLQGSLLWPRRLADRGRGRQMRRRDELTARSEAAGEQGLAIDQATLYERASRIPARNDQVAPTALGNAIRRLELYAGDRYQLDSQLLWHHLTAAAPERAVDAVERAQTNVDFFVCLVYGAALLSASSAVLLIIHPADGPRLVASACFGALLGMLSYRLAIMSTDAWNTATRAMVDHGRLRLAEVFGVTIPASFAEERLMWMTINTLVRRPYIESTRKRVPEFLDRWRAPGGASTAPARASVPEHPEASAAPAARPGP